MTRKDNRWFFPDDWIYDVSAKKQISEHFFKWPGNKEFLKYKAETLGMAKTQARLNVTKIISCSEFIYESYLRLGDDSFFCVTL